MDEKKKKELEDQLNRLFTVAGKSQPSKIPSKSGLRGARVIRRRKGQPDRQVSSKTQGP